MTDRQRPILKWTGIVLGSLAILFLLANALWYFGVRARYNALARPLTPVNWSEAEQEAGISSDTYERTEDGYCYTVRQTGYLSNSGFASVSDEHDYAYDTDENGEVISDDGAHVMLFIWPEWFSGYTYGVDIECADGWYQINVDASGALLPDSSLSPETRRELQGVLDTYRAEIDRLFSLADAMWGVV